MSAITAKYGVIVALARYDAAEATKNEFVGKPFQWGRTDCLHIAAFCLRHLGHKRPTKGVQKYTSERGALRALKTAGFASLIEAVDAYGLIRIAPAQAMAGDIVAYKAEGFGGFGLGVAIGDNRFIGCANDIIDIAPISVLHTAWRSV